MIDTTKTESRRPPVRLLDPLPPVIHPILVELEDDHVKLIMGALGSLQHGVEALLQAKTPERIAELIAVTDSIADAFCVTELVQRARQESSLAAGAASQQVGYAVGKLIRSNVHKIIANFERAESLAHEGDPFWRDLWKMFGAGHTTGQWSREWKTPLGVAVVVHPCAAGGGYIRLTNGHAISRQWDDLTTSGDYIQILQRLKNGVMATFMGRYDPS